MTDEHKARHRAELVAAFGPAEAAQLEATDDAMQARATVYERALADQRTAIKTLTQTTDGAHMLARIANVIVLEQLRCAALGSRSVPSWQEALERNRIMTGAAIEARKPSFQQEASN